MSIKLALTFVLICATSMVVNAQTKEIYNIAVVTESGTSHFIVSHRDANGELHEAGTVEAVGNSQDEVNYRFVHYEPLPGVNYYNLKAVDFDGTIVEHGYISVNAKFGYAHFDSDHKQIVLAYESDIEIYATEGSLIKSSKGSKRIDFAQSGIFIIRDLNTGVVQRIVTMPFFMSNIWGRDLETVELILISKN